MAKVTLILEDSNLATGEFHMTVDVEGSEIANKRFTPAHLVASFLSVQMSTGALLVAIEDYANANEINLQMAEENGIAKITFVFTDLDVETGRYHAAHPVVEANNTSYHTGALLAAEYIGKWMPQASFFDQLWKYTMIVADMQEDASIVNEAVLREVTFI